MQSRITFSTQLKLSLMLIIYFLFSAGSGEENVPQSLSASTVITVAISGVLVVAIVCLTAYLMLRSRNKRRHHGDIHVAS